MKAMTLYEYNDVDELGRFKILWDHGNMVADRFENGYHIILFQLYSFYVEIYHHVENNVPEGLKIFSHTDFLDPYIKEFDLSEIKSS